MQAYKRVMGLGLFGLATSMAACTAETDSGEDFVGSGVSEALTTRGAPVIERFPVNGPHNTGWDPSALDFRCNGSLANSDYHTSASASHPGGHLGNDIFAPRGTPVVAARAGRVTDNYYDGAGGNALVVVDDNGWSYYYCHMLEPALPPVGSRVTAGQLVGRVSNTAAPQAAPHLHFSIFPNGSYGQGVDPFPYTLARENTSCSASGPSTVPTPKAPASCGALRAGEGLTANKSIQSCDKRFMLVMQDDGNLVLYQSGQPLWQSDTAGSGGSKLLMQSDGNLVVYTASGAPVWASNTNGRAGATTSLQNDGNLVVYQNGRPLWASNTCCR